MTRAPVLLVGEIVVDVTLPTRRAPLKMRLGGVVHAARGLWASGISYAVAAVCPDYLVGEAKAYLASHGCDAFILLGEVSGAPNVFLIGDVTETSHQGYENLLREAKSTRLFDVAGELHAFRDVVIFPGSYDHAAVLEMLPEGTLVTMDVAYDVASREQLVSLGGRVAAIAISTSSDLFSASADTNVEPLVAACREANARYLLLKENRGGSRLFDLQTNQVEQLVAVLGETANSVGVGDVFTAVFGAMLEQGPVDAAWRGAQVATRYSQTTFPDDLKKNVLRDQGLSVSEVRALGGVALPWHDRKRFSIYLAAPDFSYIEKPEIDAAIAAMEYHNFSVRRPIVENGEANRTENAAELRAFYENDVRLLDECAAVFAVPLGRDPGTLVEVGMAIALGKPVVVYDPRHENDNTMVICGSYRYSADLDASLNGLFECISSLRKASA